MSSSSSRNRLRLYKETIAFGSPSVIPCDHCFLNGHDCIVMEGSYRLRCAECVKRGRKCVNLSWESLDRTREEYRKKVEKDEEELAVILARLMRNKKILRQAEERARKKALCLQSEMEESGEFVEDEDVDCPAADATVGLSPAVWSSLDFINNAIDPSGVVPGGTALEAGGSS
ncbi:hypothetical protein CKM354_000004700 [Cercospora kikuchii]|uniref:Uncharacterized protein n=1 Tax=Cercospora kikuchii TaxID=84275 RepID=A0A9P3C877_9PEZI|nr:uncharacterized protein CKM354_000004700 [Cercospora kikuchii]GIZ36577.1 hypothetical protein CKM354_000004700 [Cercospora kikuchii]